MKCLCRRQAGKSRPSIRALGIGAILAVTVVVAGCTADSGDGQRIGAKDPVVTQLPQVQVKLPPAPSFQREHAPEKYPDSAYSVYGLRKNVKDTIDKQVRVKGYIIEVYECPPCPKGSTCPDCQRPHFWFGDRANTPKEQALMVTDFPKEDEKTKKKTTFEVRRQYFLGGTFAKRSATGFASSDGLLIFASAVPADQAAE